MKGKIIGLLVVAVMFGTGCGGAGEEEGGTTENFFFTSAKEVAPTISALGALGILLSSENGKDHVLKALPVGSILGDIYYILRDYEYPADEGVVDMHNIYKVLYTSGLIYTNAETSCTTIAETAVQSPYDLGLSETYTCAGNSNTMADNYANGFAIKEAGGVKYGLLTYRWAPDSPTHEEHGILQGSYNESTGDLTLHMVHHVYYATEEGFVVRSHITGNDQTHSFSMASISTGTGDSPTWTSFVGKGVSQEEGNYFLFKVNNSSGIDGNYFCFPASPSESTLEEMNTANPNGSGTVDPNCADYEAAVGDMDFLTTTDVPMSIDDFAGSSILLSY